MHCAISKKPKKKSLRTNTQKLKIKTSNQQKNRTWHTVRESVKKGTKKREINKKR